VFKGFIFDLEGTIYQADMVISGAEGVVQLLRENRRKIVFLSNNSSQTQENEASKLTRFGIPTQPDEVIGCMGKPSSLIIQTALEIMQLNPEDCILIGDCLETDIKMGKDSGIATGIVLTGVTNEKMLQKYKHTSLQPDFVFQSIADVQELIIGR
jgi:ribonucleotide monophosphatase NagD (HAD superfamily)